MTPSSPSRCKTVVLEGASIEMRGLSIPELFELAEGADQHEFLSCFDSFVNKYGRANSYSFERDDIDQVGLAIFLSFPERSAKAIALSAGSPDLIIEILKLSFKTQVGLLTAVVDLTFEETGGAEAFLRTLVIGADSDSAFIAVPLTNWLN